MSTSAYMDNAPTEFYYTDHITLCIRHAYVTKYSSKNETRRIQNCFILFILNKHFTFSHNPNTSHIFDIYFEKKS